MAKNLLKNILLKEGITQAELSRESRLAGGSINKFCQNKRTPKPTTMAKITNAINRISGTEYSINDLFPDFKI